ncbi:MAG: class I SAM-dependent methyltransferase [Aquihabitans sp.]
MPEAYDRLLGPSVFQPFAEDLAARAAQIRASSVLEVAAGTGRVTRGLVDAMGGEAVTATDLNEAMVERGRHAVPEASWRAADVADLPFDDGAFDLAVCQFGVMFFPDRRRAHREVRRVLASGGRFLVSTWGPWERHGFARSLLGALDRLFPEEPVTFLRTVPHGYHEPATVRADLEAAGFSVASCETVVLAGEATASEVARGFCLGTPIRFEVEARAELDSTVDQVVELMEADLGSGVIRAEMEALVVEARRT